MRDAGPDCPSYTLPVAETSVVNTYKSLTYVACHPTEAIVATGNAMGEIMIWWNLTTSPSSLYEGMHLEGQEDDDGDDGGICSYGESESDVGHFHTINKKSCSGWRLLHPRHVKRSGMHWHNFAVTALAFTCEGKHLYSGGVEGVLVKWDLTDCFGGIKNRRFLSMLNSPIQEISSLGGDSGDCAVVLLERNCFLVVNGAMQIIYKHFGIDQTPWRWRAFRVQQSDPPTALVLPSPKIVVDSGQNDGDNMSVSLLLSGTMGCLQVVEAATAKVLTSMDVNQRHYVVCDRVPAPLVSEVLLAEAWHSGEWVATYSELQLPRLPFPRPHLGGHSLDNQAQLVWWKRMRYGSQDGPSLDFRYEAIYGEPMAHLNCQATDLKFTRHPDEPQSFQTLLILRDQRVLVWQHNLASGNDQSVYRVFIVGCRQTWHLVRMLEVQTSQRPWKLTSCVALNPGLLINFEVKESPPPPPSKLCIFNKEGVSTGKLMRSREEALTASKEKLRSIVVCATGTTLTSFMWIRWRLGSIVMEDMLPLCTYHFPSWSDWKMNTFSADGVEVCQLAILDPAKCLCVALLRPASTEKSSRSDANGALCLLFVDRRGRLIPHFGVFDLAPTGAFAVNQTPAFVAVGTMNGSCVVYDANLQVVATLPQLPLLPFCDRQRRNTKDGKRGQLASTLPVALVFLPSKTETIPPLAAVIATIQGRDEGRRDLAVYNLVSPPVSVEISTRSRAETTGLLSRVERVEDAEMMEGGEAVVGATSRLVTDLEMVRTLRRVAQYPVEAAPPPEQLLAQLFKKPEL
ncbi:unnamed protein product [Hydatigera taeniaeformis]|uniref:WD_REPEATS_REGION domain-containing protein n=1 Tax=Hydatigena taeniaeformis TaxID=6205 RepID=A0A158REZ0_HYDTA|nr:unnamed protein product [Hydatigera taeniaeformis]